MPRLGVFLVSPPEHPFYQVTTGILGYDVWQRRQMRSSLAGHLDADTLRRWLGRAASYGIHCTITDGDIAYDEADDDDRSPLLYTRTGETDALERSRTGCQALCPPETQLNVPSETWVRRPWTEVHVYHSVVATRLGTDAPRSRVATIQL